MYILTQKNRQYLLNDSYRGWGFRSPVLPSHSQGVPAGSPLPAAVNYTCHPRGSTIMIIFVLYVEKLRHREPCAQFTRPVSGNRIRIQALGPRPCSSHLTWGVHLCDMPSFLGGFVLTTLGARPGPWDSGQLSCWSPVPAQRTL